MRDLSVNFMNYLLRIVEEPSVKQKRDGSGPVVDRNGAVQYQVSLFAKRIAQEGEWAPKGEEIRVTLETDPGEGFQEGLKVELIDPRVNAWEIRDEESGRVSSGLAFKALGLKPGQLSPRAQSEK